MVMVLYRCWYLNSPRPLLRRLRPGLAASLNVWEVIPARPTPYSPAPAAFVPSKSLHLLCQPVEGMTVPECEGNKEKYDCVGCKSFKAVGICSHVLAVNHVSKKYNVRYVLGRLQTGASKTAAMKGGNTLRPPPALQRAPVADPDSSDEEEARLIELGEQGK